MRPKHLAPIVVELERVTTGPVRAVLNAPPRHGKSELLMHHAAWFLRKHPERTVGYATHEATLAWSKSRIIADYARRAGVELRSLTPAAYEWRTVQGGGCLAAGMRGSWTGRGVDVLYVDDPYKDRAEADSALTRRVRKEWFQSVANTRIEPGGSIYVTHTRWHEDDLSGWITSGEYEDGASYEVVNLPALDADGRALWPERWPEEELESKRRGVGPFEWSALYMGKPVPRTGRMFGAPARYERPRLDDARVFLVVDPAGSARTYADSTVMVALAVRHAGIPELQTADVIDVVRVQKRVADAVVDLRAFQRRHGGVLHIEGSRDGIEQAEALLAIDRALAISIIRPRGDKRLRAEPLAGAWAEGRVRVPEDGFVHPWLNAYLSEFMRFTGIHDAHDDMVDATAYAWLLALDSPRVQIAPPREENIRWGPIAEDRGF